MEPQFMQFIWGINIVVTNHSTKVQGDQQNHQHVVKH